MAKKNFIGVHFGSYHIIVKNAKKVYGHDDSWPFNADFEVLINGIKSLSGKAWNDGWGGPTNIEYERTNENHITELEVNEALDVFTYTDVKYNCVVTQDLSSMVEILAMLYVGGNNGIYSKDAIKNFLMGS